VTITNTTTPESKLPIGYERQLIVVLTITFGVVFFDRNAMSFLAPFVAPELGLNNTQIGLLTAALSLTWAVSGLILGRLADASGRRKVILTIAVLVFAASSFLSGIATTFVMLVGARMLMGAAEGGILPISQTLVALQTNEKRRGLYMGIVQNFGTHLLGSFAAPLILVAIAQIWGWRTAFFLAGVPGVICALLIAIYVREPVRDMAKASEAPLKWAGLGLLANRNILVSVAIGIAMICWMALGWIFYPVYFTSVREMSPTDMSILMSVLGLTAAAGAFVVPGLSDKFGRKPVMIICCAVGVVCPLGALFFDGSLWALSAIIGAAWLCTSGTFPLFISTIPSESVRASSIATAIGVILFTGEIIGGFFGPVGAGMAADAFGVAATLWLQVGLAIVAAFLGFFLAETAPNLMARREVPSVVP